MVYMKCHINQDLEIKNVILQMWRADEQHFQLVFKHLQKRLPISGKVRAEVRNRSDISAAFKQELFSRVIASLPFCSNPSVCLHKGFKVVYCRSLR